VKAFLKKENGHAIYAENETKSSLTERSIQNLENRMQRMFNQNHSYEFLKQLPATTNSINDTSSRPLGGMAPSKVTKKDVEETRYSAYLAKLKKSKTSKWSKRKGMYKFKINDRVRITYTKHVFSTRIRTKMDGRDLCCVSAISKSRDTSVQIGRFCRRTHNRQVLRTGITEGRQKEDEIWKVNKIIKTRTKKGVEDVLISWHQWRAKFNFWIKKSELSEI
jgi:hypothetical protein